jgi:hypothetical protein
MLFDYLSGLATEGRHQCHESGMGLYTPGPDPLSIVGGVPWINRTAVAAFLFFLFDASVTRSASIAGRHTRKSIRRPYVALYDLHQSRGQLVRSADRLRKAAPALIVTLLVYAIVACGTT